MNARRTILLNVLFCALLLGAGFLYHNSTAERRLNQKNRLKERKAYLNSIIIKDPVDSGELEELESSYFGRLSRYGTEENLYLFSQKMKEQMQRHGAQVHRYQRKEDAAEEYIEFTVSMGSADFLRFLGEFYKEAAAFTIPYINVKVEQSGLLITFLIGLDFLDDQLSGDIALLDELDEPVDYIPGPYELSAARLSRLFHSIPAPVVSVKKETPVEEEPEVQAPKSLQFVGKATIGGKVRYYLKDPGSGDVFYAPSPGWEIKEEMINRLLLSSNGINYEVKL